MAFKKTIQLPTGDSGEYIRIVAYRWDSLVKEASVRFALFKSEAVSKTKGATPQRMVAKLRLSGAKFDEYLSTAALSKVQSEDPVRHQFYAAAKAEPVISDFGPDALYDAQDV